jgi:hypothetical protein
MSADSDLLERASGFQRHISEAPPAASPADIEVLLRLADHPAILIAGHAAPHLRAGAHRPADALTGPLVLEAARRAGCSALVVTNPGLEDANTSDSPYIRSLLVRLTERRPAFVIDVHGVAAQGDGVDLYISGAGGRVPAKLVAWVEVCAEAAGVTYGLHLEGAYAGAKPERLSRFVIDGLGVPALQLEFSKELRRPTQDPGRYVSAVDFLARLAAWPDPESPRLDLGDLSEEP